MQRAKDYTRKRLLDIAKEAFFKKGFKAVSMRELSKRSGIGLSNIYNYYPCKDDLLTAVLQPLLKGMDKILEDHNHPDFLSPEVFSSEEFHRISMLKIMNLVTDYREEFKLMLFSSQDSRYKDYLEKWTERCAITGQEYLELMKKEHPELKTDISPYFMHLACTWKLEVIKGLVLHEHLSREDLEGLVNECVLFSMGGWKHLMNII